MSGMMYFAHLRYLWVSKKLIKGARTLEKLVKNIKTIIHLRLEEWWEERDYGALDHN